jgi:hypothetical protein
VGRLGASNPHTIAVRKGEMEKAKKVKVTVTPSPMLNCLNRKFQHAHHPGTKIPLHSTAEGVLQDGSPGRSSDSSNDESIENSILLETQ